MKRKLEFYFDYTSPYTYLAATKAPDLAEAAGIDLQWKPIFLGGVMEQSGNRPPAICANKAQYMLGELDVLAEEYGVDLKMPKKFPILALTALRGALLLEEDTRQEPFIMGVFRAYWVDGKDISDDAVIREVADAEEVNFDHLKFEVSQDKIKQALKDQTAESVKRGIFGAPTFFLDNKMYFGNESFPRLAKALGVPDWSPSAKSNP